MKLDASLGFEGKNLRGAGDAARAADALGFAGLWTSKTKHDAFLPLAVATDATEKVKLGTSIAVAFSRSPMVVAQTAWDLQDLSGADLSWAWEPRCGSNITMGRFRAVLCGREIKTLEVAAL